MKKFLGCVLAAVLALGVAAVKAGDPDQVWRDSVTAYMNSNGVFQAGVTNVLKGAVLPVCNGGSVTNVTAANVVGNLPAAALTNVVPALSAGSFKILNTTQLVFMTSSFTNVVDADITH